MWDCCTRRLSGYVLRASAQPDNITSTLLEITPFIGGIGAAPELDEQLRPKPMFEPTARMLDDHGDLIPPSAFLEPPSASG
jgi:hypothetical protein